MDLLGSPSRTKNMASVGSQSAAVACRASGPSVPVSPTPGVSLYQPEEISATEPCGAANAAPFLDRVAVTVLPVAPVLPSAERAMKKTIVRLVSPSPSS
jgi:hypothetical protein